MSLKKTADIPYEWQQPWGLTDHVYMYLAAAEEEESPLFTERLSAQTLMEGDSLKLKCVVTGKPMPTVEWTKDGEVIEGGNYSITFTNGVCSLCIPAVTSSDGGLFKCQARNSAGTSSCSSLVTVSALSQTITTSGVTLDITSDLQQSAQDLAQESTISKPAQEAQSVSTSEFSELGGSWPSVDSPPESLNVDEGSEAKFSCTISGDNLTVKWEKDGSELSDGDRFSISNAGGVYSLSISGTGTADAGMYSIKVSNDTGSASASASLGVTAVE